MLEDKDADRALASPTLSEVPALIARFFHLPEFPTTKLEMTAVADIFDRDGDGYIDYYEFVAALHPNKDAYRPTTDADKIEDEVKCPKRWVLAGAGVVQVVDWQWGRQKGGKKGIVVVLSQDKQLGLMVPTMFVKERVLRAGFYPLCWGRLPKCWSLTSLVGAGRSPGKWPSASVPRDFKWSRSARTNTG